MWILPKQLHTSAYAPDTKALDLDSEAFSQICEKSLSWRGKDSLSRTWLQRWKRENWMQRLCTRTLKPSHTESFEERYLSSQEDSLANPSVLLESVKQLKTQDTSSHTSQTELESANLELFSLKTYKESSVVPQVTENQFSNMSSEHWKKWVIEQRQEYSQRKKLAHLTNAKESLSWGTPNTMDVLPSRSYEAMKRQATNGQRKNRQRPGNLREQVDPLMCQAYKDAQKEANQKNWGTPNTMDMLPPRSSEALARAKKKGGCKNLREEVMQPQNWPTATVFDTTGGSYPTEMVDGVYRSKHSQEPNSPWYGAKLKDAVESHEKNWPTATARDWKGCGNATTRKDGKSRMDTLEAVAKYGHPDQAKLNTSGKNRESWPTPRETMSRDATHDRGKGNLGEVAQGKLNPNWVEQLMGLPVGWTDLGSWETE